MKYKITDLMDLYEDKNCPLPPVSEPENGEQRGAHCAPLQKASAEPKEIRATKHAFGWKEIASLAAVLGLLVLGGFGVKRLLNRNPALPGQTETTAPAWTHASTGIEEWTEEQLRSLNPNLTWLAEQDFSCLSFDLQTDYDLVRFAMTWLAKYESENVEFREEGGKTWAVLPAERVDAFLNKYLGYVPRLEPGAAFSDPQAREGEPQERYQDGEYWFRPESLTTVPRFAVCENGGKLVGTDLITVTLTVYEDLRNIAVRADPAELTASQARAMAESGELRAVRQGWAKLQEAEGNYLFANYEALDLVLCQDGDALLSRLRPQVNAVAEQGITDLCPALSEESVLVSFARYYAKYHDVGLFAREDDESGAWETLTLDQVNGILEQLLGQTVSPAEGTNYSELTGVETPRPETYENGVFRWPADGGKACTAFAVCTGLQGVSYDDWEYVRSGERYVALVEITFDVYEADENAPIRQKNGLNLLELTAAEADALAETGDLVRIGEGKAAFTYRDGNFRLCSYHTEDPRRLEDDPNDGMLAGTIWRAETPDGNRTYTRDLRLDEDHKLWYRAGYDRNWTYWAKGNWALRRDGTLHLWIYWTEPNFLYPSPERQEGIYDWNLGTDSLTLKQTGIEGFYEDAEGTELRFLALSEAEFPPVVLQPPETTQSIDTSEDLDPVGPDGLSAGDWKRFDGFLTNAAREDFPVQNGDGTCVPNDEWYPLRFARAFDLVDREEGPSPSWRVSFETYEVDPARWPEYRETTAVAQEDLGGLLEDGKITVIARGVATFRRETNGVMLLIDYSLNGTPASDQLEIETMLTELAQKGITDLAEGANPDQYGVLGYMNTRRFTRVTAQSCPDGDRITVEFKVYEFLYDPPADTSDLPQLLADGILREINSGAADFQRKVDRLELTSYQCARTHRSEALSGEKLAALRERLESAFTDPGSWYARALTSCYARPEDADLFQFFYDGIPGQEPITANERMVLESRGLSAETACDRLPQEEMSEILLKYFGLSMDEGASRGLESFLYDPIQNCWYHSHSDTNARRIEILDIRAEADGPVIFTYRTKGTDSSAQALAWTAALWPADDGGWTLVSNLPGTWVTRGVIGELEQLYREDHVWFAETRDAAGAGTARELTLRADGSFSYREGDLNSEYCLYQEGAWWLDGADTLRLRLWDDPYTDWDRPEGYRVDLNSPGSPSSYPVYTCTLAGNVLTLTQTTEDGFAEDPAGTELRFQLNRE